MKIGRSSGCRNSFTECLMLLVLVLACMRLFPLFNSFSSAGFLSETSTVKYVQESFISIQEAINEAENGSIVYVPQGVYYERIIINKTISLIGENVSTTIIDGNNGGTVVAITADNVTISGFTIQKSGWGWFKNGIYIYFADNCLVENNHLFHNCHNIRLNCSDSSHVIDNTINGDGYGIRFINSFNCVAIGNNVSNCIAGVHLENATSCIVKKNYFTQNDQGVRMYSPCTYNKIMANTVYDNNYDGMIDVMPNSPALFDNLIFHNNFINNTNPFIYRMSGNTWDYGYPSGGNYWSRYNGTDLYGGTHQNETGEDGLGDTPYAINSFDVDHYPLMHPWSLLPIHNVNTGIGYNEIQEGIDANETLNSHALWVDSGVYHENVNVNKSLTLIGEDQSTTIIDSNNIGTVLSVNFDNVSISDFTIRNSGSLFPPYGNDCGILMDHCNGCNISSCLIVDSRIGLYLSFSEGNIMENNVVSSNHENGIWLWYSGNNVLRGNTILSNPYNFRVSGGGFSDFYNNMDTSNTVDGKPIQYVIGARDEIFDNQTNTGVLYLINCNNVTVQNLNLTRNGDSIFCYNLTDSRIKNNTAVENSYGVFLQESTRNVITNNHCLKNWVGIRLYNSEQNIVEGNTAGYCEKGISLYNAYNNSVKDNTVINNIFGFRFSSASRNRIFHNNLINNTNQADLITSYQNIWDNGFEGNYWSDYNGSDSNPDGIGETPYIIDTNNNDAYPLMGMFSDFKATSELHVQTICNSSISDFRFNGTAILFNVSGEDGSIGFCRICIPKALMNDTFRVYVNGTQTPFTPLTDISNTTHTYLYFTYQHSIQEILVVPEFLPQAFLSILIVGTFLMLVLRRIRLK